MDSKRVVIAIATMLALATALTVQFYKPNEYIGTKEDVVPTSPEFVAFTIIPVLLKQESITPETAKDYLSKVLAETEEYTSKAMLAEWRVEYHPVKVGACSESSKELKLDIYTSARDKVTLIFNKTKPDADWTTYIYKKDEGIYSFITEGRKYEFSFKTGLFSIRTGGY